MTPWTELTSTLALGLGANTENLPLGLAYGLRGRKIGLVPNLLIATVTTAVTLLPLVVSRGLRGFMPAQLPDALAGLLLIALGLFDIWIDRRKREQISRAPLGSPAGWPRSARAKPCCSLAPSLSTISGWGWLAALPVSATAL
jgi:hypothetical protein